MGRYLDIARKASEGRATPPTSESIVTDAGCKESEISAKSPEHRRLVAADWKPKERCGKTIWERPDNGFYVSEEMALHILKPGEGRGAVSVYGL